MIPVSDWEMIQELEASMRAEEGASILRLFEIAGLDPKNDFRGGDWRFINFDGLDLRGCNFSGSRLYGARFKGSQVANANFFGADLDHSTLHHACDWRSAALDEQQRAGLELKLLLRSQESVTLDQIREALKVRNLEEREWVKLIGLSKSFYDARSIYSLMLESGSKPKQFTLTTLLSKADHSIEIEFVRYEIEKWSVDIDDFLVSAMISKARSESEARDIFEQFSEKVEPTIYMFNALLSKIPNIHRAEDILSRMEASDLPPDSISLNPFIWKARTFDAARAIYDRIPEPRTPDLNAVLSHARWQQIVRGTVSDLLRRGPDPDIVSFNLLIAACDRLSDGISVLRVMKEQGFSPDSYTMYNLLALIPKGKFEDALRVLTIMAKDGVDIAHGDTVKKLLRIIPHVDDAPINIAEIIQEEEKNWINIILRLSKTHASPAAVAALMEVLESAEPNRA